MDVKQFSADKILKHLDKVNEWLETGTTFPITIEMDMSNECNCKCPKCFGYFGEEGKKAMIPGVKSKEIIGQIKELGGRALTFTGGGEPLCNKATPEAIVYAKENAGLDVALITNGILLKRETIEKILPHLTWIRVSLDAATPEMYMTTHGMGEGPFRKVVENTRLLAEMKKEMGLDVTVGAGYLVGEETASGIVECAKLCKDIGVDYIQYRPFLRLHKGCEINYETVDAMPLFEEAFKLAAPGFDVLYSKHKYDSIGHGDYRPYKICYGHHFTTVIGADQCMYVCCHMRGIEKYKLGDLKENTMEEIWRGERRKKVYDSINFKDCPPLCRCNTFNEILWNISLPRVHKNFL
jgi:MoaA/NifB/PqqE/SkfB family radical SAM enzyme